MDQVRLDDGKNLSATLSSWQAFEGLAAAAKPKTLKELIYGGHWRKLIVVGHSLGGALAQIAALDIGYQVYKPDYHTDNLLTVRENAAKNPRKILLATVASAIAGDDHFDQALFAFIYANLRLWNDGDHVPAMGYGPKLLEFMEDSRFVHKGADIQIDNSFTPVAGHLCYSLWSSQPCTQKACDEVAQTSSVGGRKSRQEAALTAPTCEMKVTFELR
eukprot:TRINITY_DN15015_c0_g1_i4.p1 TRINITY_DN15015_c0_g1~~TRINITY_DN15015_c0_g1_i4.p1  ORF type:complete len:217 (-),score=33.02 TRINITY_DN15015_c0_g1_i4:906-1556(-)